MQIQSNDIAFLHRGMVMREVNCYGALYQIVNMPLLSIILIGNVNRWEKQMDRGGGVLKHEHTS